MIYVNPENSEEKIAGKKATEEKAIIEKNRCGRQDGTPKRAVLSVLLCLLLTVTVPATMTGCGLHLPENGITTETGADEQASGADTSAAGSEEAGDGRDTEGSGAGDTDSESGDASRQSGSGNTAEGQEEEQGENSANRKSREDGKSEGTDTDPSSILSIDEIHTGESGLSSSQAIDAMEEADSLAACLNAASESQGENWESAGLTPSRFVELVASQEQSYYFSKLKEKKAYQQELIYLILQYMAAERAENIEIPCKDTDEITEIFTMVTDDHPELFDVSGYQSKVYTDQSDAVTHITLTGKYTMEEEERDQLQKEMEPVIRKVLQDAPADGDDYDKVRYVYEYVIRQTDYEQDVTYNQNMCSVFIYGKSVCQGYARAAQYLLQQLGLPCVIAAGEVHNGVRHAWDIVKADGAWYHMDPTWGDPSYASKEDADGMEAYINYDYLLITTDEISRTHTLYQEDELPACTATADNYYVREGALLEKWDRGIFKLMMDNQVQKGSSFPSVKCASEDVFTQMKEDLVTEGYLSECLPTGSSAGRIRYTENADLYTMTVFMP